MSGPEASQPAAGGCFTIVFEGCDGSGTTSQIPLLAHHLRRQGYAVATRAQPSRGPIGRLLRRFLAGRMPLDPAAQALLFAADRLHLRARLARGRPGLFVPLWPWRRAHRPAPRRVLLLDRDVLSSLAYQGLRLDDDWLAAINRHSPPPDLLLFLDVSPAVAAARRARRGGRPEAFDAAATQEAIVARYRRLVASGRGGAKATQTLAAEQPLKAVTFAVCRAAEEALAAAGWGPADAGAGAGAAG